MFMRETVAPYRSASLTGIELIETYEPTPSVAIDYRVLSRAVVNLVQNAIQAMPDGGQLRVRVGPAPGADGRRAPVPPAKFARSPMGSPASAKR